MTNWSQSHHARSGTHHHKHAYHKPHTSLGATGHWARTAGILSPLVISEFVKDPEQRWRYVRLAAVATALASEALWTYKIHQEREATRARCEEHAGYEH